MQEYHYMLITSTGGLAVGKFCYCHDMTTFSTLAAFLVEWQGRAGRFFTQTLE